MKWKVKNIWFFIGSILICLLLITGCGHPKEKLDATGNGSITITDSLGRKIEIPHPVTRAVVTNEYNTEIINAIGALDDVVGVGYKVYQDHQAYHNRFTKNMVIGQNELNYEKIVDLHPQVLIMSGGSDYKDVEQKLSPFGIKVIVINAYYTDQFLKNVTTMGQIFGKEKEAKDVTDYFLGKLDYINKQLKDVPKKTLYFEYRKAGQTTMKGDYFYYMVEYSHADNIFKNSPSRQIDIEDVVKKNPAYIVKVSSPNVESSYVPPTKEDQEKIYQDLVTRPGWEDIDAVKNHHILLISHYAHGGAAKLIGTMYIAKFLYPEELPDLHPEDIFYTWVTKYQLNTYLPGHTYPAFPLVKEKNSHE